MSKKVVRKFSAFAIILVVMLASLCVFTLYQSSVNAVVLDALDDIDIDTAQISSSLDRVDVAEAATMNPSISSITSTGSFIIMGGYERRTKVIGNTSGDKDNSVSAVSLNFSTRYANAKAGSALTYKLTAYVAANDQGRNLWISGNSAGSSVYGETTGSGFVLSTNTVALPTNASSISSSFHLDVDWTAASVKVARIENLTIVIGTSDSTAPEVSATGLTGMNYTTSSQFKVKDTVAGIYSVSYTYYTLNNVPDSSKNKSFSYSSRTTETNINMPYEGKYEITVEDNVGNKRTVTYYRYEADIQFKSANSSQGTVNVTAVTGKTSGSTYDVSATVAPANGYYFTGWVRTGDGGTANFGVGTYSSSSGKWEIKSQSVPAYSGGTITWTAQFASISDWFNYASGGTMTYNGSAQTNIASVSVKNDNGGTQLSYTLTYAGTSKAGNTYSSASKPVFAGTYYAELTVTKGGGVLGSGDSSASAFTINQSTLTLTPQFTGTMSKTYNGTTAMPGVGCSTWTFDTTASPQKNDGLSAKTKTDSEFSFKIPDANAGTKTIQICDAGGAVLNVGSPLSAYVSLSTTLDADKADRVASYSLVFSGTTATYKIEQETVYVNLAYAGKITGYVGEALYNDVYGKVYDGTTDAVLSIELYGLVSGEIYSVGVSGTSAESGKTVHLTYAPYAFSYPSPGEYTSFVSLSSSQYRGRLPRITTART